MSALSPQSPHASQELSPAGWAGIVGTVFVALAALVVRYPGVLSEQNIFVLWLGGVVIQVIAGAIAIYQRYHRVAWHAP
jgi:hypothetical protein